ncbi:MAG: type II toxin-antitoxin system VapC family toxin [Deltaproteobacteria bacterium]|nr:type II toxin-antitoxin system VapC family toxin [Deltaproteobacteria bacterium]
MKLLLDTHVLLWWLADSRKLSKEVKRAIADPGNVVTVSAATIWEIAIKRTLGKLTIPDNWYEVLAEEPFQRLPIHWHHAREAQELPDHHRDPFDRMLVAQARSEGLVLATHDERILAYDVTVLRA